MSENLILILSALLAVSECLALIPAVKANSVFQLLVNILKKVKPAQKLEEPKH